MTAPNGRSARAADLAPAVDRLLDFGIAFIGDLTAAVDCRGQPANLPGRYAPTAVDRGGQPVDRERPGVDQPAPLDRDRDIARPYKARCEGDLAAAADGRVRRLRGRDENLQPVAIGTVPAAGRDLELAGTVDRKSGDRNSPAMSDTDWRAPGRISTSPPPSDWTERKGRSEPVVGKGRGGRKNGGKG